MRHFASKVRPALIVVGGLLAFGSRILDGIDAYQLALPFWAWEAIGLAIFLAAITAVVASHETSLKPNSTEEGKQPIVQAGGGGGGGTFGGGGGGGSGQQGGDGGRGGDGGTGTAMVITLGGVEFHEAREAAEWYAEQLQLAGRASVSWNSGGIIRDGKVIRDCHANLDRVILPHPLHVRQLAEAVDDDPAELAADIRKTTRDLLRFKIDVRWRRGLPSNLMTIADDWILVESVFPHLPPGHRPQWRVLKERHGKAYERLRSAYNEMWRESEAPPPEGSPEWTL